MDTANLPAFRASIEALSADPTAVYAPELSFFREYLEGLGATLPSKPASGGDGEVKPVAGLSDWEKEVEIVGAGKMVVDFTASWCPPCKGLLLLSVVSLSAVVALYYVAYSWMLVNDMSGLFVYFCFPIQL